MSHTYDEIKGQPDAWAATLPAAREAWSRIAPELTLEPGLRLLLVGCGTSLYLAQAAAQAMQEVTGHQAAAVPGSEVFLSPASTIPAGAPVLAFVISRSGETSEAILAAEHLARAGAAVVAVTCRPQSPLARAAAHVVGLPHADERSVVMTQSFTSMLLALQAIAAAIAGDAALAAQLDRLPELGRTGMAAAEATAEQLGRNLELESFIFLGLGPSYGLAQEATLKLKEMTQLVCEAYNPLEFRHGPISVVRPGTAVVLLEGERERDYIADVQRDVSGHGAHVAALAPYAIDGADTSLTLPAGLGDVARGVLYLPALQLLAYRRATTLGLDPDRPRHLEQVVVLEQS
jgi:glucosamine--fructose-6-phosphate aminotransferase (isomerizing)